MVRRYKCFVPSCPNSKSRTKDKVFVHVNELLKRRWCNQLNIEYKQKQCLYCCEDHLNLEEDLENYYQWKFCKVSPRLKSTAILRITSENEPQQIDNIQIENEIDNSSELKSLLLKSPVKKDPLALRPYNIPPSSSSTCAGPILIDIGTQYDILKMEDKGITTMKMKKLVHESLTTENMECTPTTSASPSLFGSTFETEDISTSDIPENTEDKNSRSYIISLIYKNPKMYIGLPKQYVWLIQEISKKMCIKELDILITLMKIKLNDTMVRLADEFTMSTVAVTNSFYRGLTGLASYFQNFVFMPTPDVIKQNLPLVFKIRYANVQCILDAFEIEIEKPSNPESQAQTWSQYKNCNTVKYLVGCTPNGFISYISKGYGGRISDKALVEKSDLLDLLPTNSVIMADRGFKEVESLLITKNIKLLRPPSVYSSNKPSREEVLQTKVIASLRVHIERVIRRIREFRMLKPHSVVSHKHVSYLDKIVLIACGLINLQDEIIKQI